MANKQTIAQIDAQIEKRFKRIALDVRKLDELRKKRKKILSGKMKQPEPPGKKVKLKINEWAHDEFDDAIPSFGTGPGSGFDGG